MPTTAAEASVKGRAPTSEIGYVTDVPTWRQLGGYAGGTDDGEETPALVYPTSVRTFGLMRVNGTVSTVLGAVTHPLRRPGVFAIDPQDADPTRVAKLAQDLDLPILGSDPSPPTRRRGRFSWNEHVRLTLLELVYGHMGFEILCDAEALKSTGEARLRKLAPRFPGSIAEISVERDGGLKSVTQHRVGAAAALPIPVANLLWYANEREGAAWQGRSILRPCYGDWLVLDRLLRVRAMLMERQGMGIPTGEAPEGADQGVIDLMGTLASQARAGDQSGIGIPHGARIRMVGVEGTLPDINGAIADHKAALADAVGASFLRLGTAESSGNRALGQTFVDQFTQAQDSRSGHIADTATQHAVEKLWDWNYGESDPAPAIVAAPIDAERDIDPEQLVALVAAGAITVDESVEDLLRAKYRLPKRSPAGDDDPVAATTRSLAVPEIIQKVYLGVGTMLTSDEARSLVNAAAGTELLPPGQVFTPKHTPVAAGRRPSPVAAKGATWAERVAEVLSAAVDAEAIATAALEGTGTDSEAVAAGLDPGDTAALSALLVEMWGASYGAGAEKASGVAASRRKSGTVRTSPVMASLSSMVARAGEVAAGILSSLFDRLIGGLGADDAPDSVDALADMLAGLGSDEVAASRIATTETHRAMVSGAVDTWASMGITETRWVRNTDAACDDACPELDGTTSTSGWDELPPLHPNCLCNVEPA